MKNLLEQMQTAYATAMERSWVQYRRMERGLPPDESIEYTQVDSHLETTVMQRRKTIADQITYVVNHFAKLDAGSSYANVVFTGALDTLSVRMLNAMGFILTENARTGYKVSIDWERLERFQLIPLFGVYRD